MCLIGVSVISFKKFSFEFYTSFVTSTVPPIENHVLNTRTVKYILSYENKNYFSNNQLFEDNCGNFKTAKIL